MNAPQRDQTLAAAIALATLLFHVLTAKGYGYFRDELYYVACSEHLAFGYVDHPPLVAVVTSPRSALRVRSTLRRLSPGSWAAAGSPK
jgi:hypothetical protein